MLVGPVVEVIALHPQVVREAAPLVEEDHLLIQMVEMEVPILVAVVEVITQMSAETVEMADQV